MEEKNILESIIDYIKPKAHDAIDAVTEAWEQTQSQPSQIGNLPPEVENVVQGLVTGMVGGGGSAKGVDVLQKILKRNTKGLEALKSAQKEAINYSRILPQTAKKQPARELSQELIALLSGGAGTTGAAAGMTYKDNPIVNFLSELMMSDPDMSDADRMDLHYGSPDPRLEKFNKSEIFEI